MSISLFRNADQIEILKKFYLEAKIKFKIKHSTYSTVFDFGKEKLRFITYSYNKKVFMVSQMIQRDFKDNAFVKEIIEQEFSTSNYDLRLGLTPKNYGKAINIDIKSAYPAALRKYRLISQKTYMHFMNLPKDERLVSFGMCAKKATVFEYDNGELLDWDVEIGKYAQVFYFVIQEINDLMLKLKDIAGDYYLFHWVDGIFLEQNTPQHIVDKIITFINKEKYFCKFEKIDELIIKRDDVMIECEMIKNGEKKVYKMSDKNMLHISSQILDVLYDDTLFIQPPAAPDVQLSEGNPYDDLPL